MPVTIDHKGGMFQHVYWSIIPKEKYIHEYTASPSQVCYIGWTSVAHRHPLWILKAKSGCCLLYNPSKRLNCKFITNLHSLTDVLELLIYT